MKPLPFTSRGVLPRLAAGTVALGIAAGVAAATVPTADAAATSRTGVAVAAMPHGPARASANITSVVATHRDSAISCEMVFQGANGGLPHVSGHFPGSVNVRVRVTCLPDPVESIEGYVVLFQISNKGKILRRTPPQKYGSTASRTANGNAALVCKEGYYEGESVALVTFPPGYSPHVGLLRDYTSVARIAKC
jgi:hypothetical protein